jgi:hypothetical protein
MVLLLLVAQLTVTDYIKAQSIDDIYTIVDLDVDVTDRSANRAKTLAFSEAENRAFAILLNKLLPQENIEQVVLPEGQTISNYVSGIEVVSERNSKTRYLATLNVSFNSTSMRELFGSLNIAYSEISAPPTLLLPIYDKSGVPVLWGDDNKTLTAFKEFGDKNSLVQFILPKGTFRERFQLQANDIVQRRNIERLEEFRKVYNAQRIMILLVNDDICNWGLVCLGFEWHLAATPDELHLGESKSFNPDDKTEGGDGSNNPENGNNNPTTKDMAELWQSMVQTVTTGIANEWMDKTKAFYGEYQTLQVSLRVTKISHWVTVRDKLNNVPVIREVSLDELGLPTSLIYIRHIGGLEQLRQGLLKVGLDLKEDMDNLEGWRLQLIN